MLELEQQLAFVQAEGEEAKKKSSRLEEKLAKKKAELSRERKDKREAVEEVIFSLV